MDGEWAAVANSLVETALARVLKCSLRDGSDDPPLASVIRSRQLKKWSGKANDGKMVDGKQLNSPARRGVTCTFRSRWRVSMLTMSVSNERRMTSGCNVTLQWILSRSSCVPTPVTFGLCGKEGGNTRSGGWSLVVVSPAERLQAEAVHVAHAPRAGWRSEFADPWAKQCHLGRA